MASIPLVEISKVPYVAGNDLQGRTLSTLSLHVEGEWHLWVPAEEKLLKIKGWPAEGFYFSQEPEGESDVYFEFLNFMAQKACWPSVVPCFTGIQDDLFNITASLKKFEVLYEASDKYKSESSRFVVTELEYLFSLCRSIFDLLQEMIRGQWETVKLLDTGVRKKSLPKTFSKVVLSGDNVRNAQEISDKFSLPMPLSEYYSKHAEFFQILRDFRDRFVHGGSSVDSIFVTEKGFALPEKTEPFAIFKVWDKEHQQENGLCSLRPAIAHIVLKTLDACEDYAHTIQKIIRYPPPMVPNMNLYMRGPFSKELLLLKEVRDECLWWNNA